MIQALTLLLSALQLLVAANNPRIPESFKLQAISTANLAIKVANNALKEGSIKTNQIQSPSSISVSVPALAPPPPPIIILSPPSSSPPIVPTPQPISIPPISPSSSELGNIVPPIIYPALISKPILEFTNKIVTKIDFTTNKEVRCNKDFTDWNTHCVVNSREVSEFLVECNTEKIYVYQFDAGKEYTCAILLTDKAGNDVRDKFVFIVQ